MKHILFAITLGAGFLASLSAAPMFTQCPPVGVNTGCQILITIGPTGTPVVAMDPNVPNNSPYDGSEDTLVGVLNHSTFTVSSIALSSTLNANGGLFGFDGDGPCTQTPHPANCPASGNFPGDPTGYGGPGVTFSNIAANSQSGTVNFTNGIAPGGSAYFGLEEVVTSASQITAGTPGGGPTTVPEPASAFTLLSGLAALALCGHRRLKCQ